MKEAPLRAQEEFLAYFQGPRARERAYAGQLEPGFQELASIAHSEVGTEDCHFYHTLSLPGGRVVEGVWDLRAGVLDYLGRLDYAGLRVLEFGPATGFLGFTMEASGADVTAFEIAPFLSQDLVPGDRRSTADAQASTVDFSCRIRNSWWYGRRESKSGIRVVYGDIYRLPRDLGRCDVSTFGAILLHLKSPYLALEQAAGHTDRAIVVTDVLRVPPVDLERGCLEFHPDDAAGAVENWWSVTPGAAMRMLRVLGFPVQTLLLHEQPIHPDHDFSRPLAAVPMYTVVAQRSGEALRHRPLEPEEIQQQLRLAARLTWSGRAAQEECQRLDRELREIRNSTSWRLTRPLRRLADLIRGRR